MNHRADLDGVQEISPHTGTQSPDGPAHSESLYRLGSPGPQPLPVAGRKSNNITAARKHPSSLFSSLIKFVEAIFNAPVFRILSYYNPRILQSIVVIMCISYITILLGYEALSLLKLLQIFRKKFVFKILEVLSTLVEGFI